MYNIGKFRYTTWWFDTCMYGEMITTIKFTNISIPSRHYQVLCVCVWESYLRCDAMWLPQISSFLNFQIYNTVLLNIVTMLYIRFLEFINLTARSLCTLTNISHFSHHPASGNHYSTLYFYEFGFFLDSTCKWEHTVFVLLWLIQHNALKLHPCCYKSQCFFLWPNNIPLCIYEYLSLSVHPLVNT